MGCIACSSCWSSWLVPTAAVAGRSSCQRKRQHQRWAQQWHSPWRLEMRLWPEEWWMPVFGMKKLVWSWLCTAKTDLFSWEIILTVVNFILEGLKWLSDYARSANFRNGMDTICMTDCPFIHIPCCFFGPWISCTFLWVIWGENNRCRTHDNLEWLYFQLILWCMIIFFMCPIRGDKISTLT